MGTFDILNMRLNGYDFHIGLMAGTQKWTDPKVKAVFEKWTELLPYHQEGAAGRTWQDAAQTARPEEGRHVLPGHVRGRSRSDAGDGRPRRPRLLPVPDLGTEFDAEKASTPRSTAFMITAKSPKLADGLDAAKAFLEYLGQGRPRSIMFKSQPGQRRRGQRRGHQRLQRLPEEVGRDHRRGPARSPSSSTATRAPTSPARTACRASC